MTTEDDEFGPMSFDGSHYTLGRRVLFNGVQVPIQIEPENPETHGISAVQRAAVRFALSLPPDVLELSAPAVLQNYNVYREDLGDEELPELENPVDVWQQVQATEFVVWRHFEQTVPTLLLMAECNWDEEHGLTVRFRNGIADAASQQGELGMDD